MQRLISKLPPHKALIAFEAVVRLGTVTAAAKELTSTQPAVSQQIKNLEVNLNCLLFYRAGRLLKPTSKGLQYYDSIEPLLTALAITSERLRQHSNEDNQLNIISNSGIAHFWLLPLLPELQAHFPHLHFNIRLSDNIEKVSNHALIIDFGKLHSAARHPLFTEQVCAVASSDYAKEHGLHQHSEVVDILRHPLIHMDEYDKRWLNWRDWISACGYQDSIAQPCVFLGNYNSVISEVQKGNGIALGWRCLLSTLLEEQQLQVVGDMVVQREGFGYYADAENAQSERYQQVLAYIKEKAAIETINSLKTKPAFAK